MGLGRIKREIDTARALDKAEAEIERSAKVGKLQPVLVGLGGGIVTAIVGGVYSACPDLQAQGTAIVLAALGAAVTAWMVRPKDGLHAKAILSGLLGTAAAAGLAKITALCPDLIAQAPQLVMVGISTGVGLYFKSHRES